MSNNVIYERRSVMMDDQHLKALMKKLSITNSPEKIQDSQFRTSVVRRLQKLKLEELKEIADSDLLTEEKTGSCCWKKVPKNDSADTEIVWHRTECKTMECFEAMANGSITSSLKSIQGLKAIIQCLSYWENPHPDWEGLSVIGGYLWLLSFAVQHLLDDNDINDPKGPMLPEIAEIRIKFQDIAQAGEIFSEMMENFYKHTNRVRSDALLMIKKMVRKWKLESKSPLLQRPEQSLNTTRPPKRRILNKGFDLQDEVELCNENVFQMNWTPLTIMMRSTEIDWRPFGSLMPMERIHWFGEFGNKTLDILEIAALDLTTVTGQISSIDIKGFVDEPKSHARELSGALLSYANSTPAPKYPTPAEKAKMLQLLTDYWYSVDILHEEGYKLLRLVRETRDIIRTCYVYMDTFYKWDLPSYDAFLIGVKTKKKGGSQTLSNIREIWDKFISKDGESKKLSDVSEILVMMDFSTSAYQSILEQRPIECDGLWMKLQMQSLDDNLGCGLISGVDKRKSKMS